MKDTITIFRREFVPRGPTLLSSRTAKRLALLRPRCNSRASSAGTAPGGDAP